MRYRVTCVHSDKNSYSNPSAKGSTYVEIIEAPTKCEAVMQIHQDRGMNWIGIGGLRGPARCNIAPEIYSIEEII